MSAVFTTLATGEKVEVSFRDGEVGFEDLVDVDSFIDYYLLNELMLNRDSVWKSIKLHKTTDGKLEFGPVWDFDFSAASWTGAVMPTDNNQCDSIIMKGSLFRFYIERSEENYNKVAARYEELVPSILEYIGSMVDYQDTIRKPAIKDAELWYGDTASEIIEREFKNYRLFLYDRTMFLKNLFEDSHENIKNLIK